MARFGGNKDPNRDGQKASFIKSGLTGISLVSIAVLILTGPDFYHYTKDFTWEFLSARYAPALVPVAFIALYCVSYQALRTKLVAVKANRQCGLFC